MSSRHALNTLHVDQKSPPVSSQKLASWAKKQTQFDPNLIPNQTDPDFLTVTASRN
jgi:hypothetical protein